MRIRVRADAVKGHYAPPGGGNTGLLIKPGELMPGEYERIPPGMEHKLEEAGATVIATVSHTGKVSQGQPQSAPQPAEPDAADLPEPEPALNGGGGELATSWIKKLKKKLGKAPTKDDLATYALDQFSEVVDPSLLSQKEMVQVIDRFEVEAG